MGMGSNTFYHHAAVVSYNVERKTADSRQKLAGLGSRRRLDKKPNTVRRSNCRAQFRTRNSRGICRSSLSR